MPSSESAHSPVVLSAGGQASSCPSTNTSPTEPAPRNAPSSTAQSPPTTSGAAPADNAADTADATDRGRRRQRVDAEQPRPGVAFRRQRADRDVTRVHPAHGGHQTRRPQRRRRPGHAVVQPGRVERCADHAHETTRHHRDHGVRQRTSAARPTLAGPGRPRPAPAGRRAGEPDVRRERRARRPGGAQTRPGNFAPGGRDPGSGARRYRNRRAGADSGGTRGGADGLSAASGHPLGRFTTAAAGGAGRGRGVAPVHARHPGSRHHARRRPAAGRMADRSPRRLRERRRARAESPPGRDRDVPGAQPGDPRAGAGVLPQRPRHRARPGRPGNPRGHRDHRLDRRGDGRSRRTTWACSTATSGRR